MITASTLSNDTLTVVLDNGAQILSATREHPKWVELVDAFAKSDETKLLDLLSMKRLVERYSSGDLTVSDQGVFFKDMPLGGIDVDRLMAFLREGLPFRPLANYVARKLQNPSRRAITEMYEFLEHKAMPLTPEGKIVAYKGVRRDFFSVSSGSEPLISGRRNEEGCIFNGVGEVIEMSRADVDDDFRNHCSKGLHAGSLQYAHGWAKDHDGGIILIEIDPADVVSVPSDCACSKLRCCKYKVIGTYSGPLPDTYTAEYSDPVEPTLAPEPLSTSNLPNIDEFMGAAEPVAPAAVPTEDAPAEQNLKSSDNLGKIGENSNENMPLNWAESVLASMEAKGIVRTENIPSGMTQCDIQYWAGYNRGYIDGRNHRNRRSAKCLEHMYEEYIEGYNDGYTDARKKKSVAITPKEVPSRTLDQMILGKTPDPKRKTAIEIDYSRGYLKGKEDGVKRCKRLYRDGDETDPKTADHNMYIFGYNTGYRNGRTDYKKK